MVKPSEITSQIEYDLENHETADLYLLIIQNYVNHLRNSRQIDNVVANKLDHKIETIRERGVNLQDIKKHLFICQLRQLKFNIDEKHLSRILDKLDDLVYIANLDLVINQHTKDKFDAFYKQHRITINDLYTEIDNLIATAKKTKE